MGLIEVKTAELIGDALNWAVALATGETLTRDSVQDGYILVGEGVDGDLQREFAPSTDWAQGGPLLDRHATMVLSHDHSSEVMIGGFWNPSREAACEKKTPYADGPSILVALCRAIVAAKLGDVVQVPAELVGVSHD